MVLGKASEATGRKRDYNEEKEKEKRTNIYILSMPDIVVAQ